MKLSQVIINANLFKTAHLYNKKTKLPEVERWGFDTPFGGIWIHKISTLDHGLWHDHEESFFSILIKGSYTEFREVEGKIVTKFLKVGSFNFIRYNIPHLVFCEKPFYTLCFAALSRQELSFYHNGKKIPGKRILYGK